MNPGPGKAWLVGTARAQMRPADSSELRRIGRIRQGPATPRPRRPGPISGPLIDRPGPGPLRRLGAALLCVMLAAALASCADPDSGPSAGAEARVQVEAAAGRAADPDPGKRVSPAPATGQSNVDESPDKTGEDPPKLDANAQPSKPAKDRWPKDEQAPGRDGQVLERTARLVEQFGGQVRFLEHSDRDLAAVLILPQQIVEGETPLIVSLHGFGGNSADHAEYVPLHERVNSDGFALLLPNGLPDGEGNRFWNPTDRCCDGGKSGVDDVAYLTKVVASAREIAGSGPVYFFGYSNGGFMSHHMACKGLPGLRAVASVAGTSYVEDSSCEGAPAVSLLHVHGTEDRVIQFAGYDSERPSSGEAERAFYAGAEEMVTRWSRRAGCGWPAAGSPHALLDLDQFVEGAETRAYRLATECAEGVEIELWVAEGSGHSMLFSDKFVNAVLDWLLAQ